MLSVIISADIHMLADIRYLILKPISANTDNVPIILCIPNTHGHISNQNLYKDILMYFFMYACNYLLYIHYSDCKHLAIMELINKLAAIISVQPESCCTDSAGEEKLG